mgnify:CR=1 FL=1
MADYYFKMDDMAVGYQGKTLIHDINIGIDKGEIVTLIGPNGSGKSTILKSITKQLKLIGGKVMTRRFRKCLIKNFLPIWLLF